MEEELRASVVGLTIHRTDELPCVSSPCSYARIVEGGTPFITSSLKRPLESERGGLGMEPCRFCQIQSLTHTLRAQPALFDRTAHTRTCMECARVCERSCMSASACASISACSHTHVHATSPSTRTHSDALAHARTRTHRPAARTRARGHSSGSPDWLCGLASALMSAPLSVSPYLPT
eukprot:5613312-Pleurochrysis_carterae.AAC.3